MEDAILLEQEWVHGVLSLVQVLPYLLVASSSESPSASCLVYSIFAIYQCQAYQSANLRSAISKYILIS